MYINYLHCIFDLAIPSTSGNIVPSDQSQNPPTGQSSSHSPAVLIQPASVPQVSALVEQRRLFNFGRSQSPHTSAKPSKKKKLPTCTLKFICLASKDSQRPPAIVRERTELANAGLGDKSITFTQNGELVYKMLLEKFPKLENAGGFDLSLFQRGGGDDYGFHTISPPHTPTRLKDICGQAKIYIRPIQQDIDLEVRDVDIDQSQQVYSLFLIHIPSCKA